MQTWQYSVRFKGLFLGRQGVPLAGEEELAPVCHAPQQRRTLGGGQVQKLRQLLPDGGAVGGFAEKAQAAQDTGAQLIVVRRPAENGQTAAQILARCKEVLA